MTQKTENGSAPFPAPVSAAAFREGMSHVAAAVHVVATGGPAGRAGMTVSAMTSVTDTPATLLVCVNAESHFCRVVEKNGVFSVNLLGLTDRAVAEAFGGADRLAPEKRFEIGTWAPGQSGAPLLSSAMVSFDCRLSGSDIIASHRVMMGVVTDVRIGAHDDALLYWRRAYRALDQAE